MVERSQDVSTNGTGRLRDCEPKRHNVRRALDLLSSSLRSLEVDLPGSWESQDLLLERLGVRLLSGDQKKLEF